VTSGSTADLLREKALNIGQQSERGAKETVTACVMRGCHEVISLRRAVGVSRCPGVGMLGFFWLGEGDQSDSAVS
jgi:hypothetical protein